MNKGNKKLLGVIVLIIVLIAFIMVLYFVINPTRFNDPWKGYQTPEEALLNYPWANQTHSKLSYNGSAYTNYKFIFNVWDLDYSVVETSPTKVIFNFNPTVDGEKALTFVTVEKIYNFWYVTGAGSGP